MASMTTKSFTLPNELYQEAKRRGINISAACRRGIELELGRTEDIETLKENISRKEQDLNFQKQYLNKLLEEKNQKMEELGSEENRLINAFNQCLKEHTDNYGLGRDRIKEIAQEHQADELLLLTQCEEDDRLKIENFHFRTKQTDKKTGTNPM